MLLILTAAVCTLKAIAAASGLDYVTGHYTSGPIITIANWITIIGGIAFFLGGVLDVRQTKPIPSFNTPASYIPMALVCLSLTFLGTGLLEKRAAIIDVTPIGREPSSIASIAGLCATIAILAAVSGLLYVGLKGARDYRRAITGILIIALLSVYTIYLYFSTELPINAPNKIADEVALVFAAIFFLYEVRISLGREVWHAYSGFGYVAALLLAYSSIPAITVYFINGEVISNSIYESVFSLTLFIFVVARLFVLGDLICEEDTAYIKAIAEAYRKRVNSTPMIDNEFDDVAVAPEGDLSRDDEQLMIDAVTMPAEAAPDEEERNDI